MFTVSPLEGKEVSTASNVLVRVPTEGLRRIRALTSEGERDSIQSGGIVSRFATTRSGFYNQDVQFDNPIFGGAQG